MKVMFITNEYPPYIYGGAGVHVEYLSKELAKLMEVEVRSFHDQKLQEGNLTVNGTTPDAALFKKLPQRTCFSVKGFLRRPGLCRRKHDGRRGALPYVVRPLCRYSGENAVRYSSGRNGTFLRTAAPVETRTTGARIRRVQLG